jgi:hypothetical protein
VLTAGAIDLNITFLSPVEVSRRLLESVNVVAERWVQPNDLFSYVSITASSNDGNAHQVQIYTDISGEWLTGSTSWLAEWQHSSSGPVRMYLTLVAASLADYYPQLPTSFSSKTRHLTPRSMIASNVSDVCECCSHSRDPVTEGTVYYSTMKVCLLRARVVVN